jgi:hypothetical protein
MFVLGHPDAPQDGDSFAVSNQQGSHSNVLLHNGTFGAFRMMEQDVDGFKEFLDRNSTDRMRVNARGRVCGRWRNGVPLSLSPSTPLPRPPPPRA